MRCGVGSAEKLVGLIPIALICVFLALAVPAKVFAGDAEDAVELLAATLKCPIKPYKSDEWMIGDSDDPTFVHEINKWSGSANQLRIDENVEFGEGPVDRTHVANFSDLESADTSIDRDAAPPVSVVSISCTKKAKCIKLVSGNREHWAYDYIKFHVCDSETAANARLAIDTLIKLAKSRR
jgi:hypothetical protein